MEDSGLKAVPAVPEEREEPHSKKCKMDSSQMIFEKGQQQVLEIRHKDSKPANKHFCFPKALWDFSQHNLELQEKSSTDFKTSVRQHANFKRFMNANLKSRLLENIPYIGKWPPSSCTTLRNGSCQSEKNNSDFIQLEPLVSYAKESETATKMTNISKTNEWPTRGIIFYIILAKQFIARIESLFGDVPEFPNKVKDPGCCHVCKMLQSEEQLLNSKPVRSDENSIEEVLKFCLPFKYFMSGKKAEPLDYEPENILHKDSAIFSCKKQERFSGKRNFRRNKTFRHTYTPYSKKCGMNLKLTKGVAFELFLRSKGTYRYSTVTKNGIPVSNHISQINHQQTEKSNEEGTKEWLLCPIDIREDDIFSMLCYGKKQTTSQIILSNNQNSQGKTFNIILWERSLYIPETISNLANSFRLLNYLILTPFMLQKSKAKGLKGKIVTVEPFMQKKNRKTCHPTSGFSSKKLKGFYFVLRAHDKWEKRIFRSGINCTNNNKYVSKYIVTGSKERMSKTQYNHHQHPQNNPGDLVDRKSHLDTYTKISLSSYSEEIEPISVLGDVIITDEKGSRRCIAADKGFISSHSENLSYICAPRKLRADVSCLLKQESKNKTSQYFEDRQWLKHKINGKCFPISKRLLKHPSHASQHFTPNMFHNLCRNPNLAIGVGTTQCKTSLYGKRAKPRGFEFEKLKSVLPHHDQTTWIANVLEAPKAKAIEHMNCLGGHDVLFSATIMPEMLCLTPTADDVNKRKCAIAGENDVNKVNQNLCELHFKEECAKSCEQINSLVFCNTKDCEDPREGHFFSETSRRDQFELVLDELRMFSEISKANENSLSETEINILEKESHVLNCFDSIPDQVSRNINAVIPTTDSTMSCPLGVKQNSYKKSSFKQKIQFGEEETPHNYSSSLSGEELLGPSSEKRAPCKLSWKPAFVPQTFTKEGSYNLTTERGNCLLSGIIRIQPLKTCCGPLRVGLSRKAKLKQLHPYLK